MATAGEARRKLRALGRRRASHDQRGGELTKEIQEALAEADGKITVSEQADLLQMHRTTLYRVYK